MEDLRADCVEPAFGAACEEQDADSGVKRGRELVRIFQAGGARLPVTWGTDTDSESGWYRRTASGPYRILWGRRFFLFPRATSQADMLACPFGGAVCRWHTFSADRSGTETALGRSGSGRLCGPPQAEEKGR